MFPTELSFSRQFEDLCQYSLQRGLYKCSCCLYLKYHYFKSDITHSYIYRNQDNGQIFCRAEWPLLREPCIVPIFSFSLRPFICSENIKWRPTFYQTIPGDRTSVMNRIPFLPHSYWKICIFINRCHQGMGQALKAVVKRSSRRVTWRKVYLQLHGYSESY